MSIAAETCAATVITQVPTHLLVALIGLSILTTALALTSIGLVTGIFAIRWRVVRRLRKQHAQAATAVLDTPAAPERRSTTPTIARAYPVQSRPTPINVQLSAEPPVESSTEHLPEDEDERLGALGKSGWPSEDVWRDETEHGVGMRGEAM